MSQLCYYTACNKKGTKLCSRCKIARYCSIECQTKHYPDHRDDCLYCFSTGAHDYTTIIPDDDYEDQMRQIDENGYSFIFNTDDKQTKVIRRSDSNLYQEKTGNIIRPRKWLEQQKELHKQRFTQDTNWSKLMHKYVKPNLVQNDIAIFVDIQEKKMIYLNIKTDTIIKVESIPGASK